MKNDTPIPQVQVIEKVKELEKKPLTQTYEKRLERLQKYVSKIELVMQEMEKQVADGAFEAYSEEQIRVQLTHVPDMIADAGVLQAKIQRAYEYAKLDTATIKAEIWKETNDEREQLGLTNAKDREAYVAIQPRFVAAKRQELEWKYNVDLAEVIHERYENIFASCRKLANLLEKDNQNVYNQEKYGG